MPTIHSIITKLQVYDANDEIEDLLRNPKFIQEFAESVKLLSETSRNSLSNIVLGSRLSTKRAKPSLHALKAIQKAEDVGLPSKVLKKYQVCQQCPSEFWSFAGIHLNLKVDKTKQINVFLCEAYSGINQLETEREWYTIIWRFFVLFFYDLVEFLGRQVVTASFQEEIVNILSSSSSIQDTKTTIRKNLKRWVLSGTHYSRLSDSLGYGAPFLLPQSVTDKTWEISLPLSGPTYEEAIECLKSKHFCEKANELGTDALGTSIREAILEPFRWNHLTFQENHSNSSRGPKDSGIAAQDGVTSQPEESFHSGGTRVESSILGSNRNSINALLNHEVPTQGQQSSSVSAPFQITNGAVFDGREKRGLGSQADTDGLSKRRRIDTIRSHDSSLSQPSNGLAHGQERAIGNLAPETTGRKVAKTVEVEKLKDPLGIHLFDGINATRMRRLEMINGWRKFTNTVRLHVPVVEGEDFTLEVWLPTSFGKSISQAIIRSTKDLRNLLSDYIFEATKASNFMIKADSRGTQNFAGAVIVSFSNGDNDDSDCKVEVMLNYRVGFGILTRVFS